MTRPVEFNRETVLNEAMNVFWLKGYNTTSIKDIIEATKIQPGSLYLAFGSKQKLFLEALNCYRQDIQNIINTYLKADISPLLRIEHFLNEVMTFTTTMGRNNSCLLINTLLEAKSDDKEINKVIIKTFENLEFELVQVLKLAQENGEISKKKSPESLAKFLVVGILGLRVYGKFNSDELVIKFVINNLITVIQQS